MQLHSIGKGGEYPMIGAIEGEIKSFKVLDLLQEKSMLFVYAVRVVND